MNEMNNTEFAVYSSKLIVVIVTTNNDTFAHFLEYFLVFNVKAIVQFLLLIITFSRALTGPIVTVLLCLRSTLTSLFYEPSSCFCSILYTPEHINDLL